MEKEIPLEPINPYFIYQQNVHKFLDECYRSLSEYQQFMMDSQAQWLKTFEIMIHPTSSKNPDLEEKSAKITPARPLEVPVPEKLPQIEDKPKYTNLSHFAAKHTELRALPVASSEWRRPSKPPTKKIKKFLAETFWKNIASHQQKNLEQIMEVQDKKNFFVSEPLDDLPIRKKQKMKTKDKCPNCGISMGDSMLTHCSSVCLFEDYLQSKSADLTPLET